jgi:hypothetical protein
LSQQLNRTKKKLFIAHLGALQEQFSLYFKNVNASKCEQDRNLFATNCVSRYISSVLAACEKWLLKWIRQSDKEFHQFWLLLKNDF